MIIYDYQFSTNPPKLDALKINRLQRISVRAEQFHVLFWFFYSLSLTIKPYSKSFIDQACSVKMAGYWPRSFFTFLWTFFLWNFVLVHKNAKKELGQYPAILTSRLVNNA